MDYMRSWLGLAPSETEDLKDLVVQLLPTLIKVADHSVSVGTRNASPEVSLEDFWTDFTGAAFNLHAVLMNWDFIQKLSTDEIQVRNNLKSVLNELENCFISRKLMHKDVLEDLGFDLRDETYPKLRAFSRAIQRQDALQEWENNAEKKHALDERFLTNATHIMRINNKSPKKQRKLLETLHTASEFFLSKFKLPSTTPGREVFDLPIGLSNYPLNHVRKLANALYDTLQRSWYVPEEHEEPKNGLCGIIWKVKANLRPRMGVYARSLWLLRTGTSSKSDQQRSSTQVPDGNFKSLKDLLSPDRSHHNSLLSRTEGKDLLILSFILATSFLHFSSGSWLQTSLTSENICFLVSDRSLADLDVTRPFLTTTSGPRTLTRGAPLSSPHPFPEVLSLGILLLEIARGSVIEFDEEKDRDEEAKSYMDQWNTESTRRMKTIDVCLRDAISACVDWRNFTHIVFDGVGTDNTELQVREYVLKKVLLPLETTLRDAYHIEPNTLHAHNAPVKDSSGLGSFDHKDEDSTEKKEAAQKWSQGLDGVHQSLHKYNKKCQKTRRQVKPVKVAVLDTGLQIPRKILQEIYLDEGRINKEQSESFVPSNDSGAISSWDVDNDGHGSRVGEIVLRVAPEAVLHVAKVFRHRSDLRDSKMSGQVHKQIIEASYRARVLCLESRYDHRGFGFDKPIHLISEAIEKACRIECPPLFFAATRNDGANKGMAWPAKDPRVIGVSSTDGYGVKSGFNPKETRTSYPILYAFGDGVPVSTAEFGVEKHVSGTSYATPVAAALAANLAGCIRMIVATPADVPEEYTRIPERLQKMTAMVAVLEEHMQKEHDKGDKSLLPWDFLNGDDHRILKDVDKMLEDTLGRK